MTLTHDDVRKILAILDASDCEEMRLEFGDLKLELLRRKDTPEGQRMCAFLTPDARLISPLVAGTAGTYPATPSATAPSPACREAVIPEGVVEVIAPMLGTCYRACAPGAKPFIKVGDTVSPDDTVCMVRVMSLSNPLKAGAAGTVEQVLFEDAMLVEYGQPLILIRKEAA